MNLSIIKKKVGGFTEAYADFYPLIFSVVYGHVNNADDAKDICQEIFTRLFEKFDSVENARKWLYGAMKNVLREHYRRRGRESADIDGNPDDAALAFVNGFRDTRLIIQDALEDMNNFSDEKEKVLFQLIAAHHFTYDETGRHLGLSESQVKYRYSLIIRRLTDYFRTKGIGKLEDLL